MERLSRGASLFIIAVLVALVGIIGYSFGSAQTIFSTESTTTTTTTTVESYSQIVSLLFASHLQKMELRNASELFEDYAPNAVLVWEGNAQGLQGTYSGSNISIFWCSFLCHTQNLLISNSSYSETVYSSVSGSSISIVNSTLLLSGRGTIMGNFSGTISVRIVYNTDNGNKWMITDESWNFIQLTETGQGYA